MRVCDPSRGRVRSWRKGLFFGAGIFFLLTISTHSQDAAEAARQERVRRATEKNAPKHVYTEEDLKKSRILTPEDQAKVAAKKQEHAPAPAEQNAQNSQPSEQQSQGESLGEIARRYRKEKEARAAEEVAKKSYTPFPIELPHVAHAAPRAGVPPMLKVQPEQPSLGLPSLVRPKAPRRPPDANSSQGRVSPFLPRPRLAQPPAIQVMPVVPTDAEMMVPRPVAPVAPRVANPDVRSSIATQMIRVEQGDSWWRLAVRYLGSGKRWMELRAMNPADSGQQDLLKVGTTVFVARRERRQVNSSDLPGEEGPLRIKPGDTLWTLAREHLGRGSAWTCLASLNPQIVDYTHIPIGTSIQLPAGQSSCSAAGESLR
jgi:hypothetical protein